MHPSFLSDWLDRHLTETVILAVLAQGALFLNGLLQRRADRGKSRGEAAKLAEEAEQIGLKNIVEMLTQATRDNQSQREEIKSQREEIQQFRRDLGALRDELERDQRDHAAQLARLKEEADQRIVRLERENGRLTAENTQLKVALAQAGAAAGVPTVAGAPTLAIQHTITTTAVPAVEEHPQED